MTGMQCAISNSLFKWLGELVTSSRSELFSAEYVWVTVIIFAGAIYSIFAQVVFLNAAISNYSQVEVIVTYQVTMIILFMVCALVLLDEV